jgi:transcriptional regulator
VTDREPLDLLQGTLDLLILRTLERGALHGYGVSQWLRRQTREALQVQDAALYQALRRLERRGWVEAEWALTETGRRARFYGLTRAGGKQLVREETKWRRYVEAVSLVLDPVE